MQKNNDVVSHEGIVQSIDGEKVIVKMTVSSACAGCHARHLCSSLDTRDKQVEAENPYRLPLEVGEKVTVTLQEKLAMKAVILCFLIPLVVMLVIFILLNNLTNSELVASLGSLGSIALYYFVVWLFRGKIARNYSFIVTKPLD